MPDFVNLSVYKFTPLGDLPALRERLLTRPNELQLKGTILLSTEVGVHVSTVVPPRDASITPMGTCEAIWMRRANT